MREENTYEYSKQNKINTNTENRAFVKRIFYAGEKMRTFPWEYEVVISNKALCKPRPPKAEPFLYNWENELTGWENGYEFRQFLGNCYSYLGDISKIDGIQQLCHQYYLQNGILSAKMTANRIKKFLGGFSNAV